MSEFDKNSSVSVPQSLFSKREVQDDALITECKAVLDNWSAKIPFCKIKKFSAETEFVSATEFAAFKTTVTTQIEKRWLEDHEVPYRDQPLPSKFLPKSEIDPWQEPFQLSADFASHQQSRDLTESRRVYDCSRCNASGQVTCDTCDGKRKVTCGSCDGHRFEKCSILHCGGSGQIRQTEDKNIRCQSCFGRKTTGRGSSKRRCSRCGGRGTETIQRVYYIRCDECEGKGEVRCSTCHSIGKVTCSTCGGSVVTCPICKGACRMMSYVSAEQTEEPVKGEHQYVPTELPHFKNIDSPVSKLGGKSAFFQDERSRITKLGFFDQQAAPILSAEVESCRESHQGHVIRQQISVERCSIVEYRYQFARSDFSIFVNPSQRLVEDISGPIQTAIELAQKAKNKVRAGVWGIFLGSLGIHKFVLGYTDAGFIMLGVSVIMITYDVTVLPMGLIGLIEGIIYLTKSDEDFVKTYVINKKKWF